MQNEDENLLKKFLAIFGLYVLRFILLREWYIIFRTTPTPCFMFIADTFVSLYIESLTCLS